MKKIILICFLTSLFSLGLGLTFAQESVTQGVSLEEFIRQACQNDTTFQRILIDQLAIQYQKAINIPAGDLVVSVTNQYQTFFDPKESEVDNSLSLRKLFPYTGTTISTDYTSSVSSTTRAVTSEFNTYISQSIAENAFGRNTRLLSEIVGLENDLAGHQIIEAYEDYLAALITVYLNWYSAFKNLETAENSYRENSKLLDNVKARQRSNIALPVDVNKVNIQVLAKEENLIILENQYQEYSNAVKEAMRYKNKDIEITPQDPGYYDETAISFDKDYADFCLQSRTYQVLSLLEEKSSLQVKKDADELLPSIEIKAGYLLEGNDYDLKGKNKTIYGRIDLEWPFLGQVERAEYQVSKIADRKQQLSNQSAYAALYSNLKDIYQAIARERRLITLAEQKIQLAEAIVKDESRDYSYGKVTLNEYIDEINKLESNKFSKITYTIELRKLLVEWLRLTEANLTIGTSGLRM